MMGMHDILAYRLDGNRLEETLSEYGGCRPRLIDHG
jgi:hypothetical protein